MIGAAFKAGEKPHDSAYQFPATPDSWFYVGTREMLRRGPIQIDFPNQSFAAYLTASGRIGVLSARCCHVGSNLAEGKVVGENLECPLHGWQFNSEGACVKIPTGDSIPDWARQCSFPVAEVGGQIFFFNRLKANFPLPFFDGVDAVDLLAAQHFDLEVDAPWHIASSNGFDLQHFRCSHDRVLLEQPEVECPHPLARRITARFGVAGKSWRDALTRIFSGRSVQMEVTDWCGNFVLTKAKFQRTTSYGLLCAQPLKNNRTLARVIVFVPKSKTSLGRTLIDPPDAMIRRYFIWKFLQPDVERTAGLYYHPKRMIEADRTLREYLEWLENLHTKREELNENHNRDCARSD
jgi:phenylpropionate dioxygenase-like ring-hydroxylating dioxygenase large terminal subunit